MVYLLLKNKKKKIYLLAEKRCVVFIFVLFVILYVENVALWITLVICSDVAA